MLFHLPFGFLLFFMTWKKTSLSFAIASRETSDESTTFGRIFMRIFQKDCESETNASTQILSSPCGKGSFVCYDLPWCVLDTSLGTLSNDNGDGDGNATRSGKTQTFHCA